MKYPARAALALLLLLAMQAVPQAALETGRRDALIRAFIDHYVAPRTQTLESTARTLQETVADLCAAPDEAGLSHARTAFAGTFLAWAGLQHIRYGPALEDDRHYRLQFWPDKHARTGRQLNALLHGKDPVPSPEKLAAMSVALQGLPALERLLFGVEAQDFTGPEGTRRCALARAVAANIANLAAALAAAWRGYAPPDPAAFLESAYRGYLEMLSLIRNLKLERPAGASAEDAKPKRAEAWRSHLSFAIIARNLDALGAMFAGQDEWPGLRSVLPADKETSLLAENLVKQFSYGAKVFRQRPEPLPDAVKSEDGRLFLDFVLLHLDELRESSIKLLAKPLDISEGFNSLDGD